jgi:hypothetical protein
MSFVADWWFNIGNTIANSTTPDFSSERLGCTSVRREYTRTIVRVDTTSDLSSQVLTDNPCRPGGDTKTFEFKRDLEQIVRQIRTDTFERTVFTRAPYVPDYDPYLNWQRVVDGVALGIKPAFKLLKALTR